MGVIKQGILGGFSGSVAGVVGTSWKGIAVMKAKPLSVANPRTAAQVGNRTSFKSVAKFASSLLVAIVKPLWDRFAIKESGYNAFVRANKSAFDDTGDIDLDKVIISQGTLTELDSAAVVPPTVGNTNFDFTWSATVGSGSGLPTDEIFALVGNKTTGAFTTSSAEATRATEGLTLDLDLPVQAGDEIAAYICAKSADGRLVSNQFHQVNSL